MQTNHRRWTLDQLAAQTGHEVGVSDWLQIDQFRIDRFAEATGDQQWIHTDPSRAKQSSFGSTIAHGYLLVSLLSDMRTRTLQISDAEMSVNYGLNRVRFITPVPCGSRVRAHFMIADTQRLNDSVQLTFDINLEREGQEKPACIVQAISRYYRLEQNPCHALR